MANHYETILILYPDTSTEDTQAAAAQITDLVQRHNGTVHKQDDWGVRDLAYELKKHRKGRYLFFYYEAEGAVVQNIERTLNVTESVMKYMTVRLEKPQIEAYRKQAEAAEKAEAEAAAARTDESGSEADTAASGA